MSVLSLIPDTAETVKAPEQPQLPARPSWRSPRNILLVLLGLWLLTGIFIVQADEQAVVTRFGRIVEPRVLPGIHLSLPWPLDRVSRLKVQQTQRLVIGGEVTDALLGATRPWVSQFLTGDQNIIHMRVVAQYFVGTPADFLFRSQDVTQVIQMAVESELTQQLAARSVDEVLTTEKAAIQEQVRAGAQTLLDGYQSGVAISTVLIESVIPPPEAADAFRDVASARADSARLVNEAQGYSNDIIPRARGEARRMLEEAQGYRDGKINRAGGDAARFVQVAVEYQKAERINGRRIYAEAMEAILPKIKKMIVDGSSNLDLAIIRSQNLSASPEKPQGSQPK